MKNVLKITRKTKTLKVSIKENDEKLETLKKSKEKYETADFDKSSFGDMQDDYTATPLH